MMGTMFVFWARATLLAAPIVLAACAPAPLYLSSSLHKGAVTGGEIPRDARGEPVWSAIRAAPLYAVPGVEAPVTQQAAGKSNRPAIVQEGDAEAPPMPPKA